MPIGTRSRAPSAPGEAHYYSRSRRAPWRKGESSGHVQRVGRGAARLRRRRGPLPGGADRPGLPHRRADLLQRRAHRGPGGSGGRGGSRRPPAEPPRRHHRAAGAGAARGLLHREAARPRGRQGRAEGRRGGGRDGGRGDCRRREPERSPPRRPTCSTISWSCSRPAACRWSRCGASWSGGSDSDAPSSISTPTANTPSSTGPTGFPSWSPTSRSWAWTAWPSPITATCTRPGAFYEEAKAQKIRPILGFEAYLAYRAAAGAGKAELARPRPTATSCCWPRTGPATRTWSGSPRSGTPRGSTAGPRIDKEALAAHTEGIVGLAACLVGRDRPRAPAGKYEEAKRERGVVRPAVRTGRLLARDPAARDRRGAAGHRGDAAARRRSWASAWWRPTTPTTSGARTPSRTTCCSRSAPAATSTTRSASASPARNRTSSPKRR